MPFCDMDKHPLKFLRKIPPAKIHEQTVFHGLHPALNRRGMKFALCLYSKVSWLKDRLQTGFPPSLPGFWPVAVKAETEPPPGLYLITVTA
jgi:hypothetical protein